MFFLSDGVLSPRVCNQVQVFITDENDCVPEFFQSIYSVDGVPETVTTATSLLQGESPPTTPRSILVCFFFII